MTNKWLRTPLDAFAPVSYEFMFMRLPYEYAVETGAHLQTHSMYWAYTDGGTAVSRWHNELFHVRQQEYSAGIEDWYKLLRIGEIKSRWDRLKYEEIPKPYQHVMRWPPGDKYEKYRFYNDRCLVAETVNPQWCFIVQPRLWDAIKNNLCWNSVRGLYHPPYENVMNIMVERTPYAPEASGIEFYPGNKNVIIEGYQDSATGRKTSLEVGVVPGERFDFKSVCKWPVDNPEMDFPGLQRLKTKRGKVLSRFGDADIADVLALFGIDVFNPDFYQGRVTVLNAGVQPDEPYRVEDYDRYRDCVMPGWREEV